MEKKNGFLSKRVRFTWWQKLLLIVGCTLIAVAGAWVFCEKIVSPRYISSVRTRLRIEDTETLLASASSDMTSVTYNIPGGLAEELGKVGSKGNKGLLYRNISGELENETGLKLNPRDLYDMIKVSTDPSDAGGQTVLIAVTQADHDLRQQIADAAVRQFGALLFGAPAEETQAETSVSETEDALVISFRLTDEAASGLSNQFRGVALDLVTPLEACLADDAFCLKVAEAAGVDAKAAEIRKRIGYATTADSAVMTINAAWTDTETAKKLAVETGMALAAAFFDGEAQPWQAAVDEPSVVSEDVREWPNTAVAMVLAGLIALVVR